MDSTGRGPVHSAPLKVKYHLWQQALLHLSRREPLKSTRSALSERSLVNVQSCSTEAPSEVRAGEELVSQKHPVPRVTYCDFTQIDPIIQRVPGALLEVGPPGLLEDLIDTLALLTFGAVATRDARGPWNAVGPWITFSTRGACWALKAAAVLKTQQTEEADSKEACMNIITLPFRPCCFFLWLFGT